MDILKYLESIDIKYNLYEHEAVFTVDEAKICTGYIPGIHCKNLFLRNKKGNQHYLVVLKEDREINLKELSKRLKTTNLSFASKDRLYKYLKLTPGSVSPFGLINDEENHVKVILGEVILNSETIAFHPNRNTATINIKTNDLKKYLKEQGYNFKILGGSDGIVRTE